VLNRLPEQTTGFPLRYTPSHVAFGGEILRNVMLFLCLYLYPAGPSLHAQSPDAAALQQYAAEGQKALAAGDYTEAERAYEKLKDLVPGVAEVHAKLGLIYFQDRKFDQAVSALHQALKLNPTLPRAETLLALSLSELGQYDEALPGLEEGFYKSDEAGVKRMCGLQLERAYTSLQRDNKAVEVALELQKLYPADPEVLYRTGKVYGSSASLTMRKLAQAAPDSIWLHLAEAETNESEGNYDSAIIDYRRVLAADSQRPGIHYRLGRSLLARSRQTNNAEDDAAALTEFEQELQLDPSNASAAYEIGEIHRNAGEFAEAQKFFEVALKNYSDFEEAHLGLAAVLVTLQKSELALPHIQRAIALNPENEVAWYRLSQVYGLVGNTGEQKKAFAEFQRLRSQKSNEQESEKQIFSPSDVTKQQVGTNTAH
jgi:tetratricopeptide (TPR) repeat protein